MALTEYNTGQRERFSWVQETSFGSGGDMANDGEYVGLNTTIDASGFSKNWQEVIGANADSRVIADRVTSANSYPFTLTFTPTNWKALKYIMSNADAGSDPYTHTFTVANTQETFKLEWVRYGATDSVLTLTGCVIKKITVNFQKATGEGTEGFITFVAECVAKTLATGTSVTSLSDTLPTSASALQYRHTKLTLNSTEITEVNSGNIVIDSGIDENESRYCNSTLDADIGEPIPKVFRINMTANINQADSTYLDFFTSGAALGGTNKLEFIKGANDDMIFTFGSVYGGFVANTNLEGVTNGDLVLNVDDFGSAVATDSIATY